MKKFLLSIATVLLFCLCFTMFASASDTLQEGQGDITTSTDVVTETTEPSTPKENASELVEYAINLATSSAFWTTVAGVLSALTGGIVFMVRSFNSVKALVKSKADAKTIKDEISKGIGELTAKYEETVVALNSNIQELKKELEIEKDNSKQLTVMLTSYILNTKIGTSAKGEIMKMASGIKQYTGTAVEMIEKLNNAIETAKKEEEKIDTPALDEVMSLSLN